ncbi:MAG: hypothetical protein CO064_08900 [Anaerolineae bacterium CG_4_9_14_0_8_um_filter_58_9]|nr:MAG: hypothetical protein CO064_08900 [Anaerolineae bacterium CG_4_9_14_0_8_um_filter_58_9]
MNRKFSHLFILIVILSFFSLSTQTHAAPLAGVTTRVPVASDGTQGNSGSYIIALIFSIVSRAGRRGESLAACPLRKGDA